MAGGLRLDGGTATVSDCTFVRNTATNYGRRHAALGTARPPSTVAGFWTTASGEGAGLLIFDGTYTISDSQIVLNDAERYGARGSPAIRPT